MTLRMKCCKFGISTPSNFMSKRSWSFQLKGLAESLVGERYVPCWFSLKKRGKQAGWCPDIKWGKSRKMPAFYNLFYIGLHCSFNHILVPWYGHKNRFLMAFSGKGAGKWLKDLLNFLGKGRVSGSSMRSSKENLRQCEFLLYRESVARVVFFKPNR